MQRIHAGKTYTVIIFSILIVLALLAPAHFGMAQGVEELLLPPSAEISSTDTPYQDETGRWIAPGGWPTQSAALIPGQASTASQDHFGYTIDATQPVVWIDATGGSNTGMTGASGGQVHEPVGLGFSFPYYENTYTQVRIAASGYISFNAGDHWPSQSQIPAWGEPNNVIAPYWAPLYLSEEGPAGQVYYLQGGTAPERFFVVEWAGVAGGPPSDPVGGDDHFHFQVILYENGNIRFNYHQMRYEGSSYCGAAGIEDATGEDGLNTLAFCAPAPSDHAVLFTRPEPAARVRVSPIYQSGFISPGASRSFLITIRNNGDLGEDTFDLHAAADWPVEFLDYDGTTPLVDTNASGAVDTGPLQPGQVRRVMVKVVSPPNAPIGASDQVVVTVSSSIDHSKKQTISLQAAVPSRFGQVFRDDGDGAMRLQLAAPATRQYIKVTGDGWWGYNPAVAETREGSFLNVWQRWRLAGSNYVSELEIALLNYAGQISQPAARLTDHSSTVNPVFDEEPVIAVAPDGVIAVAWRSRTVRVVAGVTQEKWNIYYALLDGTGQVLDGPSNLTQNETWFQASPPAFGAPRYWNIRLAVSDDNHFSLAWRRESKEAPAGACSSNCQLDDIYYAVINTAGGLVKPITRLTRDTLSPNDAYTSPSVTGLRGGRVLVFYNHTPGGMAFSVLDSQGNPLRGMTFLPFSGRAIDTMQFSRHGNILIAWTAWVGLRPHIHYLVMDGETYQPVSGPHVLQNPAAVTGGDFVSLAPNAQGHAVLTWMDFDANSRQNLYYALLDHNGHLLTPPMAFQSASNSGGGPPRIEAGFSGYSSTSRRQFMDVPVDYWAANWIERLYDAGITQGCTTAPPQYCPVETTTRAQMAVLLGRALYEQDFVPPPVGEPIFADVPANHWAAPWIEQLYRDGLTRGCDQGPLRYCPEKNISRDEMAVFLVRVMYGYDFTPPQPTGVFVDVPTTHWAAPWIEQLYRDGITSGCSSAPLRFCPQSSTTRAEIAVFLGRTFDVP